MLELKTDNSQSADYEHDLMSWYEHQIALLRQRRLSDLDLDNLIAELDGNVGSLRKELGSRLEVLLMHLLKCQYQHNRISGSWLRTLDEQRSELDKLLEESPSLALRVEAVAAKVYPRAVRRAARDTRLDRKVFPATIPYTRAQLLDEDFVPPAADAPFIPRGRAANGLD